MISNDIKLNIVKEENFLGTKCDFYKDENNNIYMTREQIGKALQYKNPQKGVDNLHNRNINRLSNFSVTLKLRATDGKQYNTKVYIEKGIYDICRFSKQPLADKFYDWVYDQVILLRKTGGVVNDKELFVNTYFAEVNEAQKTFIKGYMAKIEEQQTEINDMQPKVENWSAFMDSKGNITMAKLAKSLNIKDIGRNKLFKILRNKKILRYNNEPYQSYVNSGYFKVINKNIQGYKNTQTLVTGRGMS